MQIRSFLMWALALALAAGCSSSRQDKLEFGQWQTDWLLAGPFQLQEPASDDLELTHIGGFETDFLQSIGGEANAAIDDGVEFTVNGETFAWRSYASGDSIIDLDAAVSKAPFVAAYAYREIETPNDVACFLSIGSNDGARVWLNGVVVWDRPTPGGVVPDDVLVPVLLRKGKNRLLVKVEERGNKWGFCVRFLPLDQDVQPAPLFRVVATPDGRAVLRFLFPQGIVESMFREASIEIYSGDEPGPLLWQGEWLKKKEMVLPLDTETYKPYRLYFTAVLPNGREWREEKAFAAGKRREFVLFENGATRYEIVLDENASSSEQWAAGELQHWLQKVSGAFFPVKRNATAGRPGIFIGYNKNTTALLNNDLDPPDEDDESYTYENVGPNIVIVGGRRRGAMYGVMSFLENELGVRWYTPRVSRAPQKKRFVFDRLYHSESPGVRVRNDFYYEAFDPVWAARNKVNGAMGYREQPGGVEAYWSVHTFYRFMPPSEFFDQHPEYYSLIDGERVYDHAQLCLSNPDVLRIVTDRLKQTMRDYPNNLIYSVSQNDWRNPCQCDQCQAVVKREGSEAGPIIRFVNKVAEEIEKEFPEKYVGTLAYQYTRTPPKHIKPRHNVVVRLCSIECCFAHDFKSCPENRAFLDDLQGWAAIAPHLYIWDYVVNFSHYILPYPNFRVLQSNIQTFRDNKAIGIMEQAAYQSRGGEFAELRAWVLARLLWNPECDVDAVIDDFMYGYYGRSGQYVRQYFDLLHDQVTPDTHIHLGLTADDRLFTDAFIRQADVVFDRAEAVADNEEIRRRVEMARLPLMYLKSKRDPLEAKYDGTYQRFCEIVDREGITHYAERGAPHKEAFHREVEAAE